MTPEDRATFDRSPLRRRPREPEPATADPDDTCGVCRWFIDDKLLRKCGWRKSDEVEAGGVCAVHRRPVDEGDTCDRFEAL